MAFSAITRALGRSPLTTELLHKLQDQGSLRLQGLARLPKGLVASALAHAGGQSLVVITATLEEASRWAAQLEAMDWPTVHLYPTSEASPYEPFDLETDITWGQLQVLADCLDLGAQEQPQPLALVATERALQPHLPSVAALRSHCLVLQPGVEMSFKTLGEKLTQLGYERVTLVELEGQWSQRGDLLDIFPVAAELPVRLEWMGDELERIREFDPTSQRSLDALQRLVLTPTDFRHLIAMALQEVVTQGDGEGILRAHLGDQGWDQFLTGDTPEGMRRFLGLAYDQPASLLDYLPQDCLVVLDEPDQCFAHGDRWLDHVQDHFQEVGRRVPLPPLHRPMADVLARLRSLTPLELVELAPTGGGSEGAVMNLPSRPIPTIPHQFGKLAETLRQERDRKFSIWLLSAQPSRSVALLQEHDCPAQFVPNPRDYPAIDKLQVHHTPVALKYSGQAELTGFVLSPYRCVVVTDREFFGQHSLATPSYVRKRRQAASKQVDVNKLEPGHYVIHKHHGLGQFLKLESLSIDQQTREYLVLKYADGLLRVAADQVGVLSRYRGAGDRRPELNKLTGKTWENTKNKVRKAIKKVAVDLLQLYAQRAEMTGYAYPEDTPWQQEMEDSFPYQPTPDQLKAAQEVKRDMESERPMDRLVCGDVGFGKTEVAIRAIFKAVTLGKQAALLAPTTILTQQHYHTLKERFAPYPIQVGLLNRFRSADERKQILQRLSTGELDVVVGTHQLLGKGVRFRDLGLLVVDEEQRFGVSQKEKIKTLKTQVDVLTLSATPIPRTLYMALSGVREMSLITTPPPSRRPIKTHLARLEPETVRSAILQELNRGGQVFYVVPRVEGIEELGGRLQLMVPSARLAIAHGQMAEAELEATMLAFSNHGADILLCTTIIESGLDIPRVNTILIEDAQRFGLSQLYQLRGRVGRAGIQAHAWLFYPNETQLSEDARKRLRAIQEFTQLGSGYQLALRDMEIRGVGNLLGAEQSGQMTAIGFDLYMEMLEEAIAEIRGQAIPQVDDTQIDLSITAFIPTDYIADLDQKMAAYRAVATANSLQELQQITSAWGDRYGPLPPAAQQLLQVMELKQVAKRLGFSRIRPEGKQHILLETPMEEPAWNLLKEKLPEHLHSRFVYGPGRVTVRGLGSLKSDQQLTHLIQWLGRMQGALPEVGNPSLGNKLLTDTGPH